MRWIMEKVTFKVSMDNEQKLAKNFKSVEINVDMEGVDQAELVKYALKSYVIELQGQVRPNWGEFEKALVDGKFTKTLKFGEALFEGKGRGAVSAEKAQKVYAASMDKITDPVEKLKKLLADKMISQDMYDQLAAQYVR